MLSGSVKFKTSKKNLVEDLDKSLESGMNKVVQHGKQVALQNKKGNKDEGLFLTEVKKTGFGYQGRIATNFEWAPFLEYGTGRKAEMPHIGKSQTFKRTGFYFWYAPADKVMKQYKDTDYFEFNGEMYPMNAYMGGNKYVMVFEQEARPFMRPTAFELEDSAIKIIKDELRGD